MFHPTCLTGRMEHFLSLFINWEVFYLNLRGDLENRLHLGNKNKLFFLYCSLGLHYLCTVLWVNNPLSIRFNVL